MQHEEFERAVRATVQTFRGSHPEENLDVMVECGVELLPVTSVVIQYAGDVPVLVISSNPVEAEPLDETVPVEAQEEPTDG